MYTPISCDYHDVLLSKATLKTYCKIIYYSELQELVLTNSQIKDVFTKNKEEFIELGNGKIIRLDRIVSVDDLVSPQHGNSQFLVCKI